MGGRARRVFLGIVVTATLALPGLAPPVAGAAERSCTGEADFTITPGLSNEPSTGSFTTDGETGTIECGGEKGTLGFSGEYGTKDPDSCTSGGEGTSSHSYTMAAGEKVTDDVEFTYGAGQSGVFGGSFKGPRISGDFEVTPIEGDCVTAPITKAHVVFKHILVKG